MHRFEFSLIFTGLLVGYFFVSFLCSNCGNYGNFNIVAIYIAGSWGQRFLRFCVQPTLIRFVRLCVCVFVCLCVCSLVCLFVGVFPVSSFNL